MPTDCIWAIRSLAGLEKWHSSMLQVATESLHPHLHASREPTRRTSTLGFSEAVCASAAKASTTISRLLFNRCIFPGNAHYFRAGVLHLHFARNQAYQGSAHQHQSPDPDPRHQREHIRLDHGALVVVRHAAEIQVEVLVDPLQ